ncbi:hypothetical protein [Sphingopyxis terrae]|uniref:hypothetical protein n=1 Tax=Sphingopyxis terrae TaxID=33052 RepID=UPI003F7E2F96
MRISSRGLKISRGGKAKGETRFIKIGIGKDLARKLALTGENVGVRLLFGNAENAGKIKISVDATTGNFTAKRDASGNYNLTINKASADGRFALDFPAFSINVVEALRPQNGQPPHCIFKASAEMLAVDR